MALDDLVHVEVVLDLLVGKVGRQLIQKQTIDTRIVIHGAHSCPTTSQMAVIKAAVASHDTCFFTIFFAGNNDTLASALLRRHCVYMFAMLGWV